MHRILFSAQEPSVLVLLILCLATTAYLATLRDKTRELTFLLGAFSCWTLHFVFSAASEAVYPVSAWFRIADLAFGLSGLSLFIAFAHHFLGIPHKRECAITLVLAWFATAAVLTVLVYEKLAGERLSWSVGSGTSFVLFLWAESVFIRRWLGASGKREAQAHRAFALVFLLAACAVGIYFLRDVGGCDAGGVPLISSLLFLVTLLGFALIYVSYSPRPTTFQVKIAGVSLFTMLAVLTVASKTPSPSYRSNYALHAESVAVSGDTELANRLEAQDGILRNMWNIIGSTIFVLTIFPLFFRHSLVRPLEALLKGIDRIDAGERDVQIPVSFNDEIGRLTSNFNRMTCSLKRSEDELKSYAESLEHKIQERTAELARKNEDNERLLLNILPAPVIDRLIRGEATIADACPEATILFADIVNFTELSTRVSAAELVGLLNRLISEFDRLTQKHGVEKIKTIGDAYMAVAGVPEYRADHAEAAVRLAFDMLQAAEECKLPDGRSLQLRIGINSGPVIAGVIGTHKFAYDLWGDSVNTAARMESLGQPGRIQVTEATYHLLGEQYEAELRGCLEVKGKGFMPTYLLVDPAEMVDDLAA